MLLHVILISGWLKNQISVNKYQLSEPEVRQSDKQYFQCTQVVMHYDVAVFSVLSAHWCNKELKRASNTQSEVDITRKCFGNTLQMFLLNFVYILYTPRSYKQLVRKNIIFVKLICSTPHRSICEVFLGTDIHEPKLNRKTAKSDIKKKQLNITKIILALVANDMSNQKTVNSNIKNRAWIQPLYTNLMI